MTENEPNMFTSSKNKVLVTVEEEPFLFLHKNDNIKTVEKTLPKPMEGLGEKGPTPFLIKTFEMVDDPQTDSIISWSETKKSFVVWDCCKFENELLAKYFKHNKYPTFVRQLNNYGFSKVDCNRQEFANEFFQQGKKHLLKCIQMKGRKRTSQTVQQQGAAKYPVDNTKHKKHLLKRIQSQGRKRTSQTAQQQGAAKYPVVNTKDKNEAEVEKLWADHNILRTDVSKLRQQQEKTQQYLVAVNERFHSTELKQKRTLLFMIKSFEDPMFLQNLIEEVETNTSLCNERISKKRRQPGPEVGDESLMEAIRTADIDSMDDDDDGMQDQEELAMIQSEFQTLLSFDEPSSPHERDAENLETNSADVCSELFVLWEKLVEDEMSYNEEAKSAGQQKTSILTLV